MRILYVAKHNCGDNDDEGAIAYALTQLGHEVKCIHERKFSDVYSTADRDRLLSKYDFMLYHKWEDTRLAKQIPLPKAFWYFDCVASDDPSLASRMHHRREWMAAMTEACTLGFCTDGDWVAQDRTGKLVHLMQGADERYMGPGVRTEPVHPIFFPGMIEHGSARVRHIHALRERYGNRLHILGERGSRGRVHQRQLADDIASSDIVLAPNGPSTDLYWSNRVYLITGFQGFLMHPYCEKLKEQYGFGYDIAVYRDNDECFEMIDYYLAHPHERAAIARNGFMRTSEEHTYRHRCVELVKHMENALCHSTY